MEPEATQEFGGKGAIAMGRSGGGGAWARATGNSEMKVTGIEATTDPGTWALPETTGHKTGTKNTDHRGRG